jgi:hypothetical protein
MNASRPSRVLVVAHRTAATPRLLEAVRKRAGEGPTSFTLLVPELSEAHPPGEAELTLSLALPLIEEAAGGRVEGITAPPDPVRTIERAHRDQPFDEVIISTLHETVSHWLRRDLPSRVEKLGLPVKVVMAKASAMPRYVAPTR